MAKKGETRLQRTIQRALRREFKCWLMKIHGSAFQMAGVPDLLICCEGLFFGIEVKMPKGKVSDIQKEVMRNIKKAGGHCTVAITPQEAIDFVRRILVKERRLLVTSKAPAKKSDRLRLQSKSLSALFQATSGKDLHRLRRH